MWGRLREAIVEQGDAPTATEGGKAQVNSFKRRVSSNGDADTTAKKIDEYYK